YWATEEYCPGPGSARLELLSPTEPVQVGKPFAFAVRAYNTSHEAWHLRAGSQAGVHVRYIVQGPDGNIQFQDMAGISDKAGFLLGGVFSAHLAPPGWVERVCGRVPAAPGPGGGGPLPPVRRPCATECRIRPIRLGAFIP